MCNAKANAGEEDMGNNQVIGVYVSVLRQSDHTARRLRSSGGAESPRCSPVSYVTSEDAWSPPYFASAPATRRPARPTTAWLMSSSWLPVVRALALALEAGALELLDALLAASELLDHTLLLDAELLDHALLDHTLLLLHVLVDDGVHVSEVDVGVQVVVGVGVHSLEVVVGAGSEVVVGAGAGVDEVVDPPPDPLLNDQSA